MTRRHEMSILYDTRAEAQASLTRKCEAMASLPPMWPITDIRVEARLVGKTSDMGSYRWVVVGDYSAWPS